MRKLFAEAQILFGKLAEKVAYDTVMVRAGGRTYGKNALDVKKHDRNRSFGNNAHIQNGSRGAGICGGKCLPGSRL